MDPAPPDPYLGLDAALDDSLQELRRVPGPLTVLFSGGVDSGLLAWELRDREDLRLLTVGVPGAPDLADAERSARVLGTTIARVELSESAIVRANEEWSDFLSALAPRRRSILVALGLALRAATPGPVVCGQGVDELFLGYAHFRGLGPIEARARSEADLRLLREVDLPTLGVISRNIGRALLAPYLAPAFVRAAEGVPIQARMPDPLPKAFFRRWAIHRGLPGAVADRPKRAVQYGSGIDRVLARAGRARDRATPAGSG